MSNDGKSKARDFNSNGIEKLCASCLMLPAGDVDSTQCSLRLTTFRLSVEGLSSLSRPAIVYRHSL